MLVKEILIEEALKKEFLEEWVFNSDNPSEGPHLSTMKRENETPPKKKNLTKNSNEALPRRSISGGKKGQRSRPGRKNTE